MAAVETVAQCVAFLSVLKRVGRRCAPAREYIVMIIKKQGIEHVFGHCGDWCGHGVQKTISFCEQLRAVDFRDKIRDIRA